MSTNTVNINCPIAVLKELKADILTEDWTDGQSQKNVASGIELAIARLRKYGFIEITEEELAVTPLPKIDPRQTSFLPNLMV